MSVNPGSLAAQAPENDPASALARRARDTQRQATEQASARAGERMQIGKGGILVDGGGSITIQGTGQFNTNGAINTTGSISASTTVTAGTTISAGGTISGGAFSTGGGVSAGSCSLSGGLSAGGDVSSSGRVSSNGAPLTSLPSFNYQVTTGYKAAWINNDGQVGFSPSTIRVKKDLEVFPDALIDSFMTLTPYLGRYTWDDENTPKKVFLVAEDVEGAGFGPDVVPVDAEGNPETVNYSQVVVPLLAAVKRQQAWLVALEQRLTDAGL
jgi:hypothetical protein